MVATPRGTKRAAADNGTPGNSKQTPEQEKILHDAITEDSNVPQKNSERMNNLVEQTGLTKQAIQMYFYFNKGKTSAKRAPAPVAEVVEPTPPVAEDVKPSKEALLQAQTAASKPTTAPSVEPIENPATENAQPTPDLSKVKQEKVVEDEVEEMETVEVKPKVTQPARKFPFVPPQPPIYSLDPDHVTAGKPKLCGICREENPQETVSDMDVAAEMDKMYCTSLAKFLEYADFVMVCDSHVKEFERIKNGKSTRQPLATKAN